MTNIPSSWPIEGYLGINTINYFMEFRKTHGNTKQELEKMMKSINLLARDNARTPVQWNSSKNGGFTTGIPWMRVNENYKEINVASQLCDPDSLFSFWRRSLQVRRV